MLWLTIGLPLGSVLLLIGQAEANSPTPLFPHSDLLLQGGALGVLTWAVWYAYNIVMPAARKESVEDRKQYAELLSVARTESTQERAQFMALMEKSQESFQKTIDVMQDRHERTQQAAADRFERWEAVRHADSEKLDAALTALTVNCAEARHGLKAIAPKTS